MRQSARRRLLGAAISYLGGIATRVAVQLATLPILFANWPANRVGTWMMIFAVPSYLVMAGQAFSGAGGNAALAAAREDRWTDARAAFRASWIWGTGLSALAIAVLIACAMIVPADLARDFGFVDQSELRLSTVWLGMYIFALVQAALMLVPLRVSGHYPLSAVALNIAALTEIAVLALCVTQSQSFVLLAAALAGLRCLTAVAIGAIAYRHAPEVFVAPAVPLRPTLRQLLRPSLAFIILPVVYTLNLQGYTLLVGFAFGATAVAGFVAIRVVVRAIDLVMTVVYSVQFFEAGYIEGDKQAIQRRQLATMTTLTTVAIAVFACVLMLAGDWLLALFTAGKGAFDPGLAFTLLAAGALRGLATTPQSMVAAESAHGALARSYLLASLLALGAATALATAGLPLLVIVAMLIPAELVATVLAFRTVLTRLDWNVRDFLRALGSRDRLADVVHLARFLGQRS
ncbi:hypothetical protein P8R33_03465 [Qipengyuania sp. XHP0211]|uniref:hypothetical protein n=1 Tax=Qipengyuania sp. XHP0211 TaxID=3038079 RepID=UPI00241FBE15|nr:hypothetical protein [Qipengyuania sp. XHP0211]MDG5750158.1 hypothetical protein [Qipengyuania sp. XHP0211]